MQRSTALSLLVTVFITVLAMMCWQLANRTYNSLGYYISPDATFWGGGACLTMLAFGIWLLSRKRPSRS